MSKIACQVKPYNYEHGTKFMVGDSIWILIFEYKFYDFI
jgi:hypothetical protein